MKDVYKEIANTFEKLSKCFSQLAKEEPLQEKKSNSTLTIEKIREVLYAKSQCGKTAQIKELLNKFNAKKLSEVDVSDYEKLMAECEQI